MQKCSTHGHTLCNRVVGNGVGSTIKESRFGRRRVARGSRILTGCYNRVKYGSDAMKLLLSLILSALCVSAATTAGELKELHATVDFNTYVMRANGKAQPKRALKPENVEAIFARFAELGVTRVYWMHHAEDYIAGVPLTDPGVDLVELVVRMAHQKGMKVWLLFKPFETGQTVTSTFPPGACPPADQGTVQSLTGTHAMITSFVAKHPQYRLKRRDPGQWKDRSVAVIKLVKSDAKPTRLSKDELKVYASEINGQFKKLADDFLWTDTVEERDGREVRVLTLSGLDIPPAKRYILVRADAGQRKPDFANAADKLVELYDSRGELIPCTWDGGFLSRNALVSKLKRYFVLRQGMAGVDLSPWLPDAYGRSLPECGFDFLRLGSIKNRQLGHIAVAKGRDEYLPGGAMHPVYPEVRRYWIEEILKRGVKAGVDGVDIRICNHSAYTSEGAEYGFNDPIVEEYQRRHGIDLLTESYDVEKFRQINGEYFTLFLRELRKELRKHDIPLQAHINGMLRDSHFRNRVTSNVPFSFQFDWRAWIADDIVDSIALKYLPWPEPKGGPIDRRADDAFRNEVLDFARKHGKPAYDNFRVYLKSLYANDRIRQIQDDPRVAGVILYEGYRFVAADVPSGTAKLNPVIREIIAPLKHRAGK